MVAEREPAEIRSLTADAEKRLASARCAVDVAVRSEADRKSFEHAIEALQKTVDGSFDTYRRAALALFPR